ncbi:hypothetical protein HDZ31DRAFT_81933 [Schizophyllum fasciatum]
MTRRRSLRAIVPSSDAGSVDDMNGAEDDQEAQGDATELLNGDATPREGSPMHVDENPPDEERLEKEQQMWDAFRDEYFETIEQMPLHLQRQFTLMKELEQQAHAYGEDLVPTLRKYIARRHELAGVPNPSPVPVEPTPDLSVNAALPHMSEQPSSLLRRSLSRPPLTNGTSTSSMPITPLRRPTLDALSTPRTPTPFGIPPERAKPPQTTRQMLSHLAWLSDEIVRASEEKVHIAQAAYDSVDRHIRIIEQAIKEQEESISLGVRPGTRLAPMLLPDAPQLVRPTYRDSLSPGVVQDSHGQDLDQNGSVPHEEGPEPDSEPNGGQPQQDAAKKSKPRKSRGRISMPKKRKRAEDPALSAAATPKSTSKSGVRKLTLLPASTEAIDEPRYCVCNGISAGTMIACDNENCPMEWFHLSCVGLIEQPPEEEPWFCPTCRERPDRPQVQKVRPPPRRRGRR